MAGLSPHMAVASHMPASFVKYGEAEAWGDRRLDPKDSTSPKIIDHYNAYAKALVRYIADTMFAGGADGDLRGQQRDRHRRRLSDVQRLDLHPSAPCSLGPLAVVDRPKHVQPCRKCTGLHDCPRERFRLGLSLQW